MRRAVRATRTAISPRLAIRTDENMRAGPLRALPAKWYRFGEKNATESTIYRAGAARRPMLRRVAGRHCIAGAAGAAGCGAAGAGLGAGRGPVADCWGRRGGVGAVLASGFVSPLASGGMP